MDQGLLAEEPRRSRTSRAWREACAWGGLGL